MPRTGLSLRMRLRRARLDRDLADARVGERPGERALRAARLTSRVTHRDTARSRREVVTAAENPRAEWSGSIALLDRDVGGTGSPGWPGGSRSRVRSVRMASRARVLASDGMGPLYNPASERSLGEAIARIADGLDWARQVEPEARSEHPMLDHPRAREAVLP
jgi:hypothetical protein